MTGFKSATSLGLLDGGADAVPHSRTVFGGFAAIAINAREAKAGPGILRLTGWHELIGDDTALPAIGRRLWKQGAEATHDMHGD